MKRLDVTLPGSLAGLADRLTAVLVTAPGVTVERQQDGNEIVLVVRGEPRTLDVFIGILKRHGCAYHVVFPSGGIA